jgi:DNA repair exonuclease SbcCD nuclease subunit
MKAEEEDGDVALKLLHTADWHLGMRFPSFSEEDQLTLMRARMDVLDRIFGVAEANAVDAVLCAGDLFDDPLPDEVWWRGLCDKLHARAWAGRPVFLLPGNHDPLHPRSVYHPDHAFRRALPNWVHVVDSDDFTHALHEGAVLHAVPCRNFAGQSDLWKLLPARQDGDERIRVGMVHGQTVDIPGFQTNFPIAHDAAAQRGLDYLAIGDTHAFREVPPGARFPMVYPSAPEQTKFGEQDVGYVALVFFPRGRRRPMIRREKVGRWSWVERTCTSLDDLRTLATSEDLRRMVLRLRLELRVDPEGYAEVERLLRVLAGTDATHGRVGVMQIERAGLELDTKDIEAAFEDLPEVLQATVARLRAAEDAARREVAQRALYHLYQLVREAR